MEKTLYLITNSKICPYSLAEMVELALKGGVDLVQLREKDLPEAIVLELARELKVQVDKYNKKLVVNHFPRVAAAVDADGVHLGNGSGSVATARRIIGQGKLIGVSAHSLQEAVTAWREGADYLLVSHIFPTNCKAGVAPRGIELLEEIRQQTAGEIPLVALGGINQANAGQLLDCGFTNLGVMSAVMSTPNPAETAGKIKNMIQLKENSNF